MSARTEPATARLSEHARQRCAEMGLSTKVAKRTWRTRTLSRPDPQGHPDRIFVSSEAEPGCALIVDVTCDPALIVTVLWHTYTPFVRPAPSPQGAAG